MNETKRGLAAAALYVAALWLCKSLGWIELLAWIVAIPVVAVVLRVFVGAFELFEDK